MLAAEIAYTTCNFCNPCMLTWNCTGAKYPAPTVRGGHLLELAQRADLLLHLLPESSKQESEGRSVTAACVALLWA